MSVRTEKPLSSDGKPVSKPIVEVPTTERKRVSVPIAHSIGLRTKALPVQYIGKDQLGTDAVRTVDGAALEADLLKMIRGEVRFDGGTRGMYAHDASNYRMPPLGVVIPKDRQDVIQAVALARKHRCPIHFRGGGTAIPGQGLNRGLILDFAKYMNAILEIDPERQIARVQPGVVLDELRKEAGKHNLTFGPDPATHSRCTLGGMIGNNSCGAHSVMAGRTADNIEELEVLLYDGTLLKVGWTDDEELDRRIIAGGRVGEIFWKLKALRDKYGEEIRRRYPHIPRRISGYNLDELLPDRPMNVARALVGTEGTCAITLEATVKLVPARAKRVLVVMGFKDIFTAGDWVPEGLKFKPVAMEGLEDSFFEDMKKKGMDMGPTNELPEGKAWMYVEFGADTPEEAERQAQALIDDVKKKPNAPTARIVADKKAESELWTLRDEGLGATAKVPGEEDNHDGWEDAAVHPNDVGKYLRDFKGLIDKYGYKGALYGHLGDGCIHTRLNFDLRTKEGIDKYLRFIHEAAETVSRYNGSYSGEHGDGQFRGELLSMMFGETIVQAFTEFKKIWDPDWMMNPGKVVAPFGPGDNLVLGTRANPKNPKTHFKFPADKYSFLEASLRCVGTGLCRRKEGATMCPSYMVTLEEKHCTRGRARMLFEMLQGETVKDGWKSEEVKEALDLCLACKGCKGECPVQVDMATYKAEFLSHYYEGKLRPRHAFAFGLIHIWARLASWAPELANVATRLPIVGRLAKKLVGMEQSREAPKFAAYTFKEWFRSRKVRHTSKRKAILWPDTFNNHFHPRALQAGVRVMEHAGFEVIVPEIDMCCGRPLYDYGMLHTAKKWLRHILSEMKKEIESGTPIVVLEPSCASVFHEELGNLFPDDLDASRFGQQVFLLSDFLNHFAPNYKPPKLKRQAVVHGHCHHKALWKLESEEKLLKDMGLEFKHLESGCCGMAGAFGFETGEHYEISQKVGERVLLPEVRNAAPQTLIISDGFSCREQISQNTDRKGLHLAQVMEMAIDGEGAEPLKPYPERDYFKGTPPMGVVAKRALVYGAIVLLVGGAALWSYKRCFGDHSSPKQR